MSAPIVLSSLDGNLILRAVYDHESGGLKTTPASATLFVVELDVTDGDTVGVQGNGSSLSGNIASSGSTGILVAAHACTGMRSFQLYAYTEIGAATGAIAQVEYSPSDSAEVWSAGSPLTSSLSASGVVASSLDIGHIARRARVNVTQLPSSGNVSFYLMEQGN